MCPLRAPLPCPPVVTAPLHRGCPAGTHCGDDSSREDDEPSELRLCAVLVLRRRGMRIRQPGTVELVICVLPAMKCPHFLSIILVFNVY